MTESTALVTLQQAADDLKARDWTPSVELAQSLVRSAQIALQDDSHPRRAVEVKDVLKFIAQQFRRRNATLLEGNLIVRQRLGTEYELGLRLREAKADGRMHRGGRPRREKPLSQAEGFHLLDIGVNWQDSAEFQRLTRHAWADYEPLIQDRLNSHELSTDWLLGVCKQFCQPAEPAWPEPAAGTYDVIYADPPWRYDFVQSDSRAIENQYPTASTDELCALTVPAAEAAVLFMWATNPKLAEALRVVEAWGFSYRTNLVWVKDRFGMGYYAREQHELLLVAKRGDYPAPVGTEQLSSVIQAPRARHSEKPAEVYDMIERMYPNGQYLELFARIAWAGNWTTWGFDFGDT